MQELIHPVNALVLATDIVGHTCLFDTLILYQCLSILFCAHNLRQVISVREAERSIKRYLCSANLTSLGLHHHNAIGTTSTIDGG